VYLVALFKTIDDDYHRTVVGMIYDKDGKYYSDWGFPQNLTVANSYAIYSLRNGTLFLITQGSDLSWSVLSTVTPNFIGEGKK
jgi:hypothetical protein